MGVAVITRCEAKKLLVPSGADPGKILTTAQMIEVEMGVAQGRVPQKVLRSIDFHFPNPKRINKKH